MWFPSILQKPSFSRKPGFSAPAKPRRGLRLNLEQLEDRTLMSNYSAATVSELIADINAANAAGGTNTITLTVPTTSPYVLTAVDNTSDGANGLPVIANKDALTIIGNGDTIERNAASGTPDFRLFDVASGASLTLENLTLQNGLAFGSGSSAEGGAIYNQGNLILSAVTVQNNLAQGSPGSSGCPYHECKLKPIPGGPAAGGGIWSGSSLTLENGTLIHNNQAIGGTGGMASQFYTGSAGGAGFGGGLYIGGGQANLTGVTVSNNSALGGTGNYVYHGGGSGYGGGLYVDRATVTLSSDTVDNNLVSGTVADGDGFGGGLYVAGGTVNLSGDTVDGNLSGGQEPLPLLDIYYSERAYGGGMYLADGTVTLSNDTFENNQANGADGAPAGGGLYITAATVYIDAYTLAHVINNTWNGTPDNIFGPYILT
jgi:hypothetical protein